MKIIGFKAVDGSGPYVEVVAAMYFRFDDDLTELPEAMDSITKVFEAIQPERVAREFGAKYEGGEAKVSVKTSVKRREAQQRRVGRLELPPRDQVHVLAMARSKMSTKK